MSSYDFSTDLDSGLGGGSALDLDALLNDEPAGNEGGNGGEDGGKKETIPEGDAALKRANELLAQQLAQSSARISELEKQRGSFDNSLDRTPPAPPAVDPAKLKADLAQLMVDDPGEFALRLWNSARESAVQEMTAKFGTVAAGNAMLDVDAYRNNKTAGGKFADVQTEFDTLVSDPAVQQQLAGLTPQARRASLDFMWDAAEGRASRKRTTDNADMRDRQPPGYGGGQSFTLGTEIPGNLTLNGKPLNAVQKEILRTAKEAGITDKARLRSMLQDAANE